MAFVHEDHHGDGPTALPGLLHQSVHRPLYRVLHEGEYDEVIRQVVLFLEGRTDEVVRELKKEMKTASVAMEYERAGRIRDQLTAIERVTERQAVASTKRADEDVFGPVEAIRTRSYRCCSWETRMVGTDSFTMDGTKDESDGAVMAGFVKQYYESATYVPRRVIVPEALPEQDLIETMLAEARGGPVEVLTPLRGEKRRLLEMATKNAEEAREMARVKWLADSNGAAAGRAYRGPGRLPRAPKRIGERLEHQGHRR